MSERFLPKPKDDAWTGCMSDDPPALQPVPVADRTPATVEEAVAWLTGTRTATPEAAAGTRTAKTRSAKGEGAMTAFTLHEDKAREWLAKGIAVYEGEAEQSPADETQLPDIGEDYQPGDYDEHSATDNMIANARYADVITGPGEIGWFFCADGEGEAGYCWRLYLGEPGQQIVLSSYYDELRHLAGARDQLTGAEAALAVLREAVRTGNRLLADLERYIETRPREVAPHYRTLAASLSEDDPAA